MSKRRSEAADLELRSNASTRCEPRDDSLAERIYQGLRIGILDGSLEPGSVLRQEQIAQRFSASRVPVREAMGRLEGDGLIVSRPRRGYAVQMLQHDEIVEIFELRVVLEEHAARIAALARTQDDIDAVALLVERMEQLARAGGNYGADWARLNRDFHMRLVASSRRRRLSTIVETLRDSVETYVRAEMGLTGDVRSAMREHREILEAFRAGDAEGLAELSRRHIQGTARRLLDGLRKRSSAKALD
jgi:DNA-binding GntR family transcriptional regulator